MTLTHFAEMLVYALHQGLKHKNYNNKHNSIFSYKLQQSISQIAPDNVPPYNFVLQTTDRM